MNSIQDIFNQKENDLLSIFFTAGFPKLDDTTKIIEELGKNSVDFIEVGLPYSDPLADGPTIQHSSDVALKNGMNLDVVFKQLESIKDSNKTPLVLMGYLNQIIKYGEDKFCKKVKDCGIDTVIIPDLPMVEYENHYQQLFKNYGITNVFLITPHTSDERIRKIDSLSDAFIYVVASASITGAKGEVSEEQINYFKRIQTMNLQSKLIVGFGISDHKTFSTACEYANGAIIGSAFIKELEKKGVEGIGDFVKTVKNC
ncbi:tryptophan synthase subunit alpha [Tenacibaculum discolor]|uniref:tryptophan synthase subunit alpha n=1 Tax=Tenacibaculum discolor TaxID=361581 RepID=UPI000EACC91E|nr:tryptophan synthase subunit alpha [Tenacibaculum discolor]RLK06815.1 tryptophan synthase alpha chain [Tenacibaculum discolor]